MEQVLLSPKGEECGLSNETMVLFLASAIAYADQRFTPRNRFVFYRMLLSFLDHSKAIPQAAMAHALDMTPVTYRVSTKRQKDRFLEYKLLMEYYDKSLEAIPNAQAIQSLRMDYSNDDGMMHEGMPMYGYVSNLDISILYPKIKHYLAVSG